MFNRLANLFQRIICPSSLGNDQIARLLYTGGSLFFIASTYSICRRLKDIIIAKHLDFSYISFIKMFIVLPGIAILLIIFNLFRKKVSLYKYIHIILVPFLCIFSIYGLVEFYNPDLFHIYSPNIEFHNMVSENNIMRSCLYQLSVIVKNIWYVVFYFVSESFGTFGMFAFWSYVNSLTEPKLATQLYPCYIMFSSFSNVFSGMYGFLISYLLSSNKIGLTYERSFNFINIFSCVILIALGLISYHFSYNENYKFYSIYKHSDSYVGSNKTKKKMSFFESFKGIFTDKTIFNLSMLIIGYMSCINIAEVSWKQLAKVYFNDVTNNPKGMNFMFSMVQVSVGVLTLLFAYISQYILSTIGWTFTAMISPISVGFTASLFLISKTIYVYSKSEIILIIALIIGFIQNVASKACKYSFFDSSKELVFVHMDEDERIKAKSIADVVPSRGGKSLGSFIQMGLIYMRVPVGKMNVCLDVISKELLFVVCILSASWIACTVNLGKIMENKIKMKDKSEPKNDN